MKFRRLIVLIITVAMLLGFSVMAFAETYSYDYLTDRYGQTINPAYPDVYDLGDYLDDSEEAELSRIASLQSSNYSIGIHFLVFPDALGRSTETFTDDFYDFYIAHGGENGLLIAIDYDNRQVFINTEGVCIAEIDDEEIDSILDATYSYVSSGNHMRFFTETLERCLYAYSGDSYVPFDYGNDIGVIAVEKNPLIPTMESLIVSAVATVFVVVVLLLVHNKNNRAPSAETYMGGGLAVKKKNVIPLGVRTEVIHDFYKQESSGGGGSSHMSGGGVSHGGGGHGF